MNNNRQIIEKLKELIDNNGPEYLADNPYETYRVIVAAAPDKAVLAGAILMLLSVGVWDSAILIKDQDEISKKIQKECCFNKKMSDSLSDIIGSLYSEDNSTEWKNKCNEGLKQFLKHDHTFNWEGFSVWDAGSGTIDCFYDAEIVLHPTKAAGKIKELEKLLKKNPFMTEEAVYKFFEKSLEDYLNSEY